MKCILIAIFMFSLTSCASVTNNYCLRGKSPGDIPRKFEKIKVIAMEEAVNCGIAPMDENVPYIIKPTRYNRWKGEITYMRPEIEPYFSIKFERNRVCIQNPNTANTTDDRPHRAVTAIIDRVQQLR